MSKIPTAEEYLLAFDKKQREIIKPYLRQYARLHVQAALEVAAKNAYVQYIDLETEEIFDYTDVITDDGVGADVNKSSILNSYPLDNIK